MDAFVDFDEGERDVAAFFGVFALRLNWNDCFDLLESFLEVFLLNVILFILAKLLQLVKQQFEMGNPIHSIHHILISHSVHVLV